VIHRLTTQHGQIVTRDELLEKIWKTPFAGSNKVEAVIRTLRKKLGRFAASIETVTGHGYRFSGWKHD
jgi:DNA-binding response OmpR family regulator